MTSCGAREGQFFDISVWSLNGMFLVLTLFFGNKWLHSKFCTEGKTNIQRIFEYYWLFCVDYSVTISYWHGWDTIPAVSRALNNNNGSARENGPDDNLWKAWQRHLVPVRSFRSSTARLSLFLFCRKLHLYNVSSFTGFSLYPEVSAELAR